ITTGESSTAPEVAGTAPPPFLLFFFFFSAELSTVVCCPCERVEEFDPSLTVTSPFCAMTVTESSETCFTSNSVQPFEVGATVMSPVWVLNPLEVATFKLPCSRATAGPSNLTRESARTTTFEPEALMLATESDRVCTRSPGKTADVRGTAPPLIHAAPRAYSIAGLGSAAHRETGTRAIIIQQAILRSPETLIHNSDQMRILLLS